MAGKNKTVYVCEKCGYESAKWYGQCPACYEWNTMNEELRMPTTSKSSSQGVAAVMTSRAVSLKEITQIKEHRYFTGIGELDNVLGGGLVKGSVVLLSGDPGIGKSTILLQICQTLGQNLRVLYVSGEESPHQIKLRADRLGVNTDHLLVLCETDAQLICEYVHSDHVYLRASILTRQRHAGAGVDQFVRALRKEPEHPDYNCRARQ